MDHSIAVGSIFIECNHFGGTPADMNAFRRSEFLVGNEMLAVNEGVIGGMLATLKSAKRSVAPLIHASACPSGPVTDDCYVELKDTLLLRLKAALPIDGVLLGLHGAAAAESTGDLEGDLISSVREIVGPSIPIVVTLDLHAHITDSMVTESDALLAWETYPHRDAFETGQRGARALLDILSGALTPTMAVAKVPVMVSAIHGGTDPPGPFAELMQLAKSWEHDGSVYSAGAILAHPYLDVSNLGSGGVVITNGDMQLAAERASQLAEGYWKRRFELEPRLFSPDEAIRLGLEQAGQVILVETADCCGGGAAGDSIATIRELLNANLTVDCIAPLVDPEAARSCHESGVGSEVTLQIGYSVDRKWGSPITVTGRVLHLTDGAFRYEGGIWDGRLGEMGPAAVLQIGSLKLCIATHPTYEWCGEQMKSLDVDTGEAKFVVAKNPMNYGMAFPTAAATYVLDTPGPTPATLRHVPFTKLQRPYFPLDEDIPDLQPTIVRSRSFPGA